MKVSWNQTRGWVRTGFATGAGEGGRIWGGLLARTVGLTEIIAKVDRGCDAEIINTRRLTKYFPSRGRVV